MSGPYGPNETPGQGEEAGADPTQQWSGQPQPGQPSPPWGTPQQSQQSGAQPQWGQSGPSQQQWAPPGQQSAQPGQQPGQAQWGQQNSSPSWPQQPPPQGAPWEATQQAAQHPGQPQWGQAGQQPWGQQQPPQWGQQHGQPQQQWGNVPEPQLTTTPAKKSKKGLLFGGVGLLVVVLAVVLAVVFLSNDELDNKAVQDGVQKVLKDSYGIDDVQNVSCPSGQEVKVGNSFDCSLKVGGEQKKVTVKVTKDDATYEVGRPN
ncbi:MAG: DUF4333 domain-containing protein [Nocardia sp.]|nr:DUF4333 domain-containing protein [Nocardia sp.]